MTEEKRFSKYFVIKSRLEPDLVLEVESGTDKPGTSVVLGEYDDERLDHQMWFVDDHTSTIRCKLNSFCLDVQDDALIVRPYMSDMVTQRWTIGDDKIELIEELNKVITVKNSEAKIHAPVIVKDAEDTDAQSWIIEHCPAQYFYIRSMQDPKKVMDVAGDSTKPGTKVLVYPDKGDLANNQLWYEDERGIIRSKINSYILDASGKEVITLPLDENNPNQKWSISGSHIRCRSDPQRVLEMKLGGKIFGQTQVIATTFKHDEPLQNWMFDFAPCHSTQLSHSRTGKFFLIRSRYSGLVLEVKDQSPGSQIVTAFRNKDRKSASNQMFYIDEVSGTVRSELNNFCIDVIDKQLVINPFDPYSKSQQWRITGHKIHSRTQHDLVWSLAAESNEIGVNIVTAKYDGGPLQQWDIKNLPAKCFYIVSQLNGKVIDVCGDDSSAGAKVIMYERKKEVAPNQLWYEDENGVVRSHLNGYVMDSTDGNIKMRVFDPNNSHQYWTIVGDRLQNRYDNRMVIDIAGENKDNKASLCAYRYMGADNQRWKFDFV